MSLRYAYNTNGLTSHRLDDALALLADCGYDGVALTLDVAHHDPFAADLSGRTAVLRRRLDALGLANVVETGARFLLDPRRKHHPTLVSPAAADRARRVAFLHTCVDVAADLGSEAVSFWAVCRRRARTGPRAGTGWSTASRRSLPTPTSAA
jgi:sugar phosphate isomerase/epimerase